MNDDAAKEPAHPSLKMIFLLIVMSFILSLIVTIMLSDFKGLQFMLGELSLIIPTFLYLNSRKYRIKHVLRLYPIDRRLLAPSFLLGVSLPVISDEIDRIIAKFIEIPPEIEKVLTEALRAETMFEWIGLVLGAVVIAGLAEEMLFRGLLQQALERRYDWLRAIFLSAVVFAMVHPVIWTLQVFLMGVVLGFIAWRSGSVIPGIILHSLNNLFSLIYFNLGLDETSWYEWYGHVNPPVIAVAACVVFYAVKWFNHYTPLSETSETH